jgi:hypothetical protein
VLRDLLNHGAIVNTADMDGVTPPYVVSQDENVEILRDLLNHGSNAKQFRSVAKFAESWR